MILAEEPRTVQSTHPLIWTRAEADWNEDKKHFDLFDQTSISILRMPCIYIEPIKFYGPVSESFDIGIFTSAAAVRFVLDSGNALAPVIRACKKMYTHGRGTYELLRGLGLPVTLLEAGSSEKFTEALAPLLTREQKIVWPSGEDVAFAVHEKLQAAGFRVEKIDVYRTTTGVFGSDDVIDAVQNLTKPAVVAFASPSAVQGFSTLSFGSVHTPITAVVIGATTSKAVTKFFPNFVQILSIKQTMAGLAETSLSTLKSIILSGP